MLDLNKFVQDREVIVPILGNQFQFEKKKYSVKSENGWFKVVLNGNKARAISPVYSFQEIESHLKPARGYSYNNNIVFNNFDVAKRKWGFEVIQPLHFNSSQSFNSIKAVVWEDKKVYFTEPDYSDFKIFEVKSCFENESLIESLKGITPEIRSTFIFHSIERDQLREMEKIRLVHLAEKDRAERERQMMATVQGRLKVTFERAGARLMSYNISGKRITVDWEINGSGQMYNSVIDADTFKVIEAGYCMSGEDRKHNITSMVKLAEDYEENDLTYITRR